MNSLEINYKQNILCSAAYSQSVTGACEECKSCQGCTTGTYKTAAQCETMNMFYESAEICAKGSAGKLRADVKNAVQAACRLCVVKATQTKENCAKVISSYKEATLVENRAIWFKFQVPEDAEPNFEFFLSVNTPQKQRFSDLRASGVIMGPGAENLEGAMTAKEIASLGKSQLKGLFEGQPRYCGNKGRQLSLESDEEDHENDTDNISQLSSLESEDHVRQLLKKPSDAGLPLCDPTVFNRRTLLGKKAKTTINVGKKVEAGPDELQTKYKGFESVSEVILNSKAAGFQDYKGCFTLAALRNGTTTGTDGEECLDPRLPVGIVNSPEDQSSCDHVTGKSKAVVEVKNGRCTHYESLARVNGYVLMDTSFKLSDGLKRGATYHVGVYLQDNYSGKVGIMLGGKKSGYCFWGKLGKCFPGYPLKNGAKCQRTGMEENFYEEMWRSSPSELAKAKVCLPYMSCPGAHSSPNKDVAQADCMADVKKKPSDFLWSFNPFRIFTYLYDRLARWIFNVGASIV